MTVYIQDVRDYLSHRMKSGILGDETIQAQLETAGFLVRNTKSDDLSSADEDIVVRGVAGWLSYLAYTTEIETARGEVPETVWAHLDALEKVAKWLLDIAAKMSSTGAAGLEGLTGNQRSELHPERIAGSLPEGDS